MLGIFFRFFLRSRVRFVGAQKTVNQPFHARALNSHLHRVGPLVWRIQRVLHG